MGVVSSEDFHRIRASVSTKEESNRTQSKPMKLKRMSEERVSRWKDTLASKRKAKLDWKQEKSEKEEERRKALDMEEAALRQKFREATIRRANRLLYEENDKVKVLRSQQLYTDVISHREDQIEEKRLQETGEKEDEKKWHQDTLARIRHAELRENKQQEASKVKAREIARTLKMQKDDVERRKALHVEQQKEEEEAIIKNIALDDMAAEQKVFLEKLENRKRAKVEMEKVQNELIASRDEAHQREKQEVKKREDALLQMNNFAKARAALEKKQFDRRQETRKLLSDRASKELELRSIRELELFAKEQRQQDERAKARNELEIRSKKELDELVDQSRREQIRLKQEQAEADKRQSMLLSEQFRRMTVEQQKQELEEEQLKRRRNLEIRRFQEQQCEEKRRKREKEKQDELLREQEVSEFLVKEDNKFTDFALREIERFAAQGKRTSLLERAMRERCQASV